MNTTQPNIGLLLSDDMIFTSRIVGTGRDLGLDVKSARTSADLVRLAVAFAPTGIVLDLSNPGLDLPALLAELRQSCREMSRVIAYGSHVDTARLKAAREAGCDLVLPRSKFVEVLPTELSKWLAPKDC